MGGWSAGSETAPSAFEVVFVYSRREGSLDLSFPGPYRYVEPLQEMFATAILKLDRLPDEPANPQVYDLNPLLQRSFEFVYGADSGIEAVTVRKLQMSSRAVEGNRISVETESSDRPEALYDLLDSDGRSIPYKYYGVTQAEMVARMAAQGGELARTIRICLAGPASCSLDYGERELKLRAMLKASGLELRRTEPDRVKSPENRADRSGRARVCLLEPDRPDCTRELDRWPSEAVTALKAQKILRRQDLPAAQCVRDASDNAQCRCTGWRVPPVDRHEGVRHRSHSSSATSAGIPTGSPCLWTGWRNGKRAPNASGGSLLTGFPCAGRAERRREDECWKSGSPAGSPAGC